MYHRRTYAAALAAILAVSVMTGCTTGSKKISVKEGSEAVNRTQSSETAGTETLGDNTQSTGTEAMETVDGTQAVEETKYPEIISKKKIKDYKSVITVGNSAYELYTYLDDVADNYAKSINQVAKNLEGTADVYDLVIPLSSEITFPDNMKGEINSSSQQKAMENIQGKMSDKVKTVDIYDTLMKHRTEEIYFRTDHHWTALGAYYAYEDFCKAKGIEPESLEEREKVEFDGFLGSFYNDTKDAKLKAEPDTVVAYKPKDDSIMHVTASDGTKYDWPVIYDVSDYGASLKYSTFIASDNPYTVIENKDLDDGSSCIVVKESFGNAFVPFLVDHYQTIYVVDYRYWTGSISKLAKDKNVSDVLFMNNLSMIRNKSLVGKLHRVV